MATVGRLDKLIESGDLESLMRSGSRFCRSSYNDISYNDDEVALSSHQAAQLLQVSPSSVVGWINQGKLRASRTPGGHRRVRVGDLREFLEKNELPVPALLRPRPEAKRIFVVDDEPAVLRSIQRAFERLGGPYEVDGCEDGIEALVRLGADIPDLVLLDIYMEGIDGFEVCRRLKRIPQLEGTQIVAITAHPSEQARARILDYGAVDYWVKPVRVEQILALLGSAESVATSALEPQEAHFDR